MTKHLHMELETLSNKLCVVLVGLITGVCWWVICKCILLYCTSYYRLPLTHNAFQKRSSLSSDCEQDFDGETKRVCLLSMWYVLLMYQLLGCVRGQHLGQCLHCMLLALLVLYMLYITISVDNGCTCVNLSQNHPIYRTSCSCQDRWFVWII